MCIFPLGSGTRDWQGIALNSLLLVTSNFIRTNADLQTASYGLGFVAHFTSKSLFLKCLCFVDRKSDPDIQRTNSLYPELNFGFKSLNFNLSHFGLPNLNNRIMLLFITSKVQNV